jgi:hypothetical protein
MYTQVCVVVILFFDCLNLPYLYITHTYKKLFIEHNDEEGEDLTTDFGAVAELQEYYTTHDQNWVAAIADVWASGNKLLKEACVPDSTLKQWVSATHWGIFILKKKSYK